jgi:hypothetical protein
VAHLQRLNTHMASGVRTFNDELLQKLVRNPATVEGKRLHKLEANLRAVVLVVLEHALFLDHARREGAALPTGQEWSSTQRRAVEGLVSRGMEHLRVMAAGGPVTAADRQFRPAREPPAE